MPNSTETAERIAKLETKSDNTNEKIDKLATAVDTLSKEVRTLSDAMNQAKGGWWVLCVLGTVSGGIGAFLAYVLSHVQFKIGG